MNRRAIKAGSAYVEVGIRNRLQKGARQVSADLKQMGSRVRGFGYAAVGATSAILGPLLAATKGFADTGDQIHKMALRTGVSAKALSGLGFAAEQSGSDIDSVEKGFAGLSRTMLDFRRGGTTSADAFERLGLTLSDLDGLSPEEQMMRIADALNAVGDESTKGAIAQQIFGRAGRQLLPLLKEGSSGMKALTDEAASLGRVLSEEDAASAAALTDAMNRVKSVLGGVVLQVGGALAPAMSDLANLVAANTSGFVEFIRENRGTIQAVAAVAAGIGAAGIALVGLGSVISLAGVAIGGLATVFGALLSPIGLVVGGVAALGYGLIKYTDLGGQALDWLTERFGPLIDTVKSAANGIFNALKLGDTQAAWELAMDALEAVWLDLTSEIRETWADIVQFVLDTGSNMASGLGKIFEGLAGVLQSILSGYESYYNKVYNSVVDLGGKVTGVKTIGGRGNAFQQNLGGAKSGLQSAIDGIRVFGQTIQDTAQGQMESRREQREADREERRQRLDNLRQTVGEQEAQIRRSAEQVERDRAAELEKARRDAEAQQSGLANEGIADAQGITGPTGTFSAFGALVGISANEQREDRKVRALETLVKQGKDTKTARFA